MADAQREPPPVQGSTGDIPSGPEELNAPGNLRLVLKRLDEMNARIDNVMKPPTVRLGDALQILSVLTAVVAFILIAMNINSRISDVENRTGSRIGEAETRLGTKIDHLGDEETKVDERLSRMEGERAHH